jgi:hypothetical protein
VTLIRGEPFFEARPMPPKIKRILVAVVPEEVQYG